jgi:hypothetical protein
MRSDVESASDPRIVTDKHKHKGAAIQRRATGEMVSLNPSKLGSVFTAYVTRQYSKKRRRSVPSPDPSFELGLFRTGRLQRGRDVQDA